MKNENVMTSRNRVAQALAHKEPDQVPYDQTSRSSAIEAEAYQALKDHLGIDTPTSCFLRSHADMEEPVRQLLGVDTEFVRYMPDTCWQSDGKDQLFIDAWDVPWRRKQGTLYYELAGNPFAALDYNEILSKTWKPLITPEMAVKLQISAAKLYTEHDSALFSDQIGAGLFERAWYLRGLEHFLVDMMLEKAWVHRYMERILQHQIEGYKILFDAVGNFISGILLTDDLATQHSLMFSRDLYLEMIHPYQKRLISYIKSRGIQTIFHSCGAVYPLIPDLLDAGVEILHPIQRSAAGMDPARIKQEFGKDLVIWGAGCDTELLQKGTPQEIADDVKKTIDVLGRDGGLVYTTTHCIQPGTPPENILAMTGALHG